MKVVALEHVSVTSPEELVDDFGDIVGRLRAAGCHIEQASKVPGRKRFYTRDPARNRLEIITIEDDA